MTKYSQRDPRWANQKFGLNGTIGKFGCTGTCISMLLDITPDVVFKRMDEAHVFGWNTKTGCATDNLIRWDRLSIAFPQLKFVKRVRTYNNTDVKNNLPCLVEVDFDGTPRKDDRHWVLFVGNKRMYDPWTGQDRSTSTYPLLGYAVLKRV